MPPRVVSPPWAKKSACMSNATAAISTLASGPMTMAAMGVPAGCDTEPATGTGIGIRLMANTAAPINATSDLTAGSASVRRRTAPRPAVTPTTAGTAQATHHSAGSMPSAMCTLESASPTAPWVSSPANRRTKPGRRRPDGRAR